MTTWTVEFRDHPPITVQAPGFHEAIAQARTQLGNTASKLTRCHETPNAKLCEEGGK